MNERERFRNLFDGERVDRPPLLEEGVREGVVERWRSQGMPADRTHLEIFGLTPHENLEPDLDFLPRYSGRVMRLSAREYGRAFEVSPRRFPRRWRETARRLEHRGHIVCIQASRGFFQALGVEDWPTLEEVLLGTIRDPSKIRSRMEIYGEFCARMLETALRDVEPEFVYLSEPIADNNAPLISPAMFEEFMIPVYERIVTVARAGGCGQVAAGTWGNAAALFPSMIAAGVTILWVFEAAEAPELDYRNLRDRYGPRLGLIGGIPMSALRSGSPDRIEERMREIVPSLMRSGRYLPLAGGRIREDVSWQAYECYRRLLGALVRSDAGWARGL